MDARPIGIFDSGLGGLTAVRRLRALLPREELVFLGDTGRVPYGGRSRETLRRFAQEDLRFLLEKNVKAVVVACGTVSSVAPDILRAQPIPVCGVVEPAVQAAAARTRSSRVGIIGTAAAMAAGAYEKALRQRLPDCAIFTAACPRFVPLIEAGVASDDPELLDAVEEYLGPMRDFGADTLILGCTHYPLIGEAIRRVIGSQVAQVDVAAAAVEALKARLAAEGSLNEGEAPGSLHCHVTGSPGQFAALAGRFLQGSQPLLVSGAALDTQE